MKKLAFILSLCLFLPLILFGCGAKEVGPAKISRDDARTGGSLSFVYDKEQKTVFLGGDGEIIQYSSQDEIKNLAEGNRIGLKIAAPDEKLDFSSSSLEMNGVTYSSKDFLESINGQQQPFFEIQPLVSKNTKEICFSVTWSQDTKTQDYKIVIEKGTKLMQKDGKVIEISEKD